MAKTRTAKAAKSEGRNTGRRRGVGSRRQPKPRRGDSILALKGLGRELWADEDPDDYVRRLREGY